MLLKLPEKLRERFKEPLGPIIQDSEFPEIATGKVLITIGDVTTKHVLAMGFIPRIMIIDGNTKRGEEIPFDMNLVHNGRVDTVKVKNPAGCLSSDLFRRILDASANLTSTVIFVDGEEDLAILPSLLLCPMKIPIQELLIVYGQPDRGMVIVAPGWNTRALAKELLDQFEEGSE